MPQLTITANRRAVRTSLAAFERDYPREVIQGAMRPWARQVVATAKRTRSFKNRTGNLRRNLRSTVETQRLRIRFEYGVPYGHFVDQGTRTIKARQFWRDSIRRNRRLLTTLLEDATQDATRRSGF